MRKILLGALLLSFAGLSQAQTTCSPDPIAVFLGIPGLAPNPALGPLPDGTVNVAYSQTLTVIVPADTTIDLSQFGLPLGTVTVSINYMELGTVTGLPAGMMTYCNQAGCQYPGGTNGCMKLYGTPTQAGTYSVGVPLSINIQVPQFGAFSTPAVPVPYDLTINGPVAVNDPLASGFRLIGNAPNPFSTETDIRFVAPAAGDLLFEVTDLQGRNVYSQTAQAQAGEQLIRFQANGLSAGTYLYSLSLNGQRLNGKMTLVD